MLIDKIYYCIIAEEVFIKFHRFPRGKFGDCCVLNGEVRIDLSQDDPVHTLIHEVTHFLFPQASEEWVSQRAIKAFQRLSQEEYNWFKEKLSY